MCFYIYICIKTKLDTPTKLTPLGFPNQYRESSNGPRDRKDTSRAMGIPSP